MRTTKTTVITLGLGLAVVAAWAASGPSDRPRSDSSGAHDEREANASAVEPPQPAAIVERARLDAPAAGSAAPEPANAPSPELQSTALAAPAPAQAPGDDGPPAQELSPRELSRRLDQRFSAEAIDRTWAREASEQAQRIGGALGPQAAVAAVECRASMCRLATRHTDLSAFQESMRATLGGSAPGPGWNGPLFAAVVSDPEQPGEVEAVIYLARAGVDLSPTSLQ